MRLHHLFIVFLVIRPQLVFPVEREYDPHSGPAGVDLLELKLATDGEDPSAKAHNDLGIACAAAGQPYEAIAEFERAHGISPGDAAIAFNLGVAHTMVKNYAEALKYLSEAARLYPDNAAALFNIGIIHLDIGMAGAAADKLERALLLSPRHPLIHYNLAIAYEYNPDGIRYGEGFPGEKALAHYRNAIEGGLDNVAVRYNLGILHSKMGDYEKGCAEFTKACELDPSFTLARRDLALALVHSGKYHRAIQELERAMAASDDPALSSTLALAHGKLGSFYLENGDYERALNQFGKALNYNKNDAVAYLNIGRINTVLGNYDAALRELKLAAEMDPELDTGEDLAKIYFLRGADFEKGGYYRLAFAEYRKAVGAKHDFVLGHLILGELCSDKLGKNEEAVMYFKRCLELAPRGAYSKQAAEKLSALTGTPG